MMLARALRSASKLREASVILLKDRAYATAATSTLPDVNKSELIKRVSKKTGMNAADSKLALEAMVETVIEAVSQGQKVNISGFGAFVRVSRAPRQIRDVRTGANIDVPAHWGPVFRSGKTFTAAVKTVKWTPQA